MLLLQQMIVLFFMMLLGFFVRKKEYISDSTCKQLSWLVVNVANPAMIISGSVNSEKVIRGSELISTLALAVSLFFIMIVLSRLLPLLLRVDKCDVGVYSVMLIFSNIGFMGFPLINAIYGGEALVYAAVFQIPFNVLIYTYGILALQSNPEKKEKMQLKKIVNIGTVCCAIAIIISQCGITAPTYIKSISQNLSNLTAPLSMMVIGASMVNISLKELFRDVKLMIFCLIKLIILPILLLFVLKGMIGSEMLLGVCMVMIATPVASMTAMLAQQYDGNYSLASKGVALSTILSVITMPIVSLVTGI